MTTLRKVWRRVAPIAQVLVDWTQSIGMALAAIGAWAAALKYMAPLLRDSSSLGFGADILMFCLVFGPLIWAVRRFARILSKDDVEDEDEVTERVTE